MKKHGYFVLGIVTGVVGAVIVGSHVALGLMIVALSVGCVLVGLLESDR
jgi:hypothetical protein